MTSHWVEVDEEDHNEDEMVHTAEDVDSEEGKDNEGEEEEDDEEEEEDYQEWLIEAPRKEALRIICERYAGEQIEALLDGSDTPEPFERAAMQDAEAREILSDPHLQFQGRDMWAIGYNYGMAYARDIEDGPSDCSSERVLALQSLMMMACHRSRWRYIVQHEKLLLLKQEEKDQADVILRIYGEALTSICCQYTGERINALLQGACEAEPWEKAVIEDAEARESLHNLLELHPRSACPSQEDDKFGLNGSLRRALTVERVKGAMVGGGWFSEAEISSLKALMYMAAGRSEFEELDRDKEQTVRPPLSMTEIKPEATAVRKV